MTNPLRLAILISNTRELPAWEMEMIRNIQHSGIAVINAFLIAKPVTEEKRSTGIKLFQKFEDWWFRSLPDAFKKSALTDEYISVPFYPIEDNKKIGELALDVIYCSCLAESSGDLASFARYGLWNIAFGPGNYARYEQVAFWDVMNDSPETGSSLLITLAGTPGRIIVYKGTTSTVSYSVKNTLNCIGWKSSSFLRYRLTELSKTGAELFFPKYKRSGIALQHTAIDLYEYPGNFKIFRLFLGNVFRYLGNKFLKLFRKKRFTLLFSQREFQMPGFDFNSFTPLKLPKNIFWADPFVIEKEQRKYVFFEEFLYKKNKAHISVSEFTSDGHLGKPAVVLDRPYHLSYPFIFESAGSFYMIPETSSNKTVELYKCNAFPFEWKFVQNLMENIVLSDATLIFHGKKWWLFGTNQEHPFSSSNDQLLLFYSDNFLSSDWIRHPQNPVATQISNCRPAGRIFELNSKLYRPAQNNSSRQYGYAIKINEIEILNENEYREKEVFEIVPGKGNKLSAVHTINFVNNLVVIDGIIAARNG